MLYVDKIATGNKIKEIIKEKELRIVDIQDIFGFNTPQAIYKWMRGDILPSIDNLIILADIFDCKIDEIIVVKREK
jgi:transcriptional regulator with XRE-family HTH domain